MDSIWNGSQTPELKIKMRFVLSQRHNANRRSATEVMFEILQKTDICDRLYVFGW